MWVVVSPADPYPIAVRPPRINQDILVSLHIPVVQQWSIHPAKSMDGVGYAVLYNSVVLAEKRLGHRLDVQGDGRLQNAEADGVALVVWRGHRHDVPVRPDWRRLSHTAPPPKKSDSPSTIPDLP